MLHESQRNLLILYPYRWEDWHRSRANSQPMCRYREKSDVILNQPAKFIPYATSAVWRRYVEVMLKLPKCGGKILACSSKRSILKQRSSALINDSTSLRVNIECLMFQFHQNKSMNWFCDHTEYTIIPATTWIISTKPYYLRADKFASGVEIVLVHIILFQALNKMNKKSLRKT